jgi:hypothetical protein
VLDCTIIYILLIIEHNVEVLPGKKIATAKFRNTISSWFRITKRTQKLSCWFLCIVIKLGPLLGRQNMNIVLRTSKQTGWMCGAVQGTAHRNSSSVYVISYCQNGKHVSRVKVVTERTDSTLDSEQTSYTDIFPAKTSSRTWISSPMHQVAVVLTFSPLKFFTIFLYLPIIAHMLRTEPNVHQPESYVIIKC